MGRREDLEASIRQSVTLIGEYDGIARLSSDPKERERAAREGANQQQMLTGYLVAYRTLCQTMEYAWPPDIAEAAALQGIDLHDLPPIEAPPPFPAPQPVARTPHERRRIRLKYQTLQQQYEGLMERVRFLTQEQTIQSDPSMRFTLHTQIADLQQQLAALEPQLAALEQQMRGEEPAG